MGIPIIAGAVKIAVGQVLAAKLGKKVADQVTAEAVKEIVEKVSADPVVKNEVNAEAWWQSRVAWGSIVAALGVVLPPLLSLFGLEAKESEILRYGDAILTLGGALYALYGRFAGGLKPLFAKG